MNVNRQITKCRKRFQDSTSIKTLKKGKYAFYKRVKINKNSILEYVK